MTNTAVAEYKIRIQGAITERSSSKPLAGVNVVCGGTWIATTDIDGKYTIQIAPDAEVLFYFPGYEDVKTKVNSRQIIDVEMSERVHELAEVIVIEKATNKKVGAEPTDLEVVGNYFHLKTKFRIPAKLFKANKRFVVQPTLYDASRKQYRYFRPVVIDGDLFIVNNLRFNDFDVSADSLQAYVVPNNLHDTDHIYMYHDSIYIDSKHLDNDFRAECYLAINEIMPQKGDYLDTVVVARGTKNPLRFFEYKFAPKQLLDSMLVPKPEMKLMSEQGVSRIAFELGKSILDPKYVDNTTEIAQIQDRISSVLNNGDAVLQTV
ncbi:MAG: carboxypeptidase-like regulatory domain-containing protein, partial [Tannerellaceae bacterium]